MKNLEGSEFSNWFDLSEIYSWKVNSQSLVFAPELLLDLGSPYAQPVVDGILNNILKLVQLLGLHLQDEFKVFGSDASIFKAHL